MTTAKLSLSLPEGVLQEFTLSKATVLIGRATTSDIVLLDPTVSRAHARVERTPLGYEIVELGSANGLRINGVARSRATLSPGDVLRLGDSAMRFDTVSDEPDPDETRTYKGNAAEATLIGARLATNLPESGVPRFAIHTSAKTWEVLLEGDRLTIGRDPGGDVVLDHPAVSRFHAVVERHADTFALRDLESRNGTWLGRQRVSRATLADSDTVRIGPARLVFKRGIADDDLTLTGNVGAAWAARRPVVVIPGFAGSALWLGRERVWPTMRMLDIPDLLRMDQPLEARGIVEDVVVVPNLIRLDQYSHLTNYLRESLGYETGKDLLEYGYDFRQDNRESARRLASTIEAWRVTAPITIIAHSMGCLVARYYVERLGGAGKVERVILLGGPHAGTPYAFASLFRGPDLLPLGVMNGRLREVLTTFPSWYQILPTDRCVSEKESSFDVLRDESWVLESNRPNLRRAREFRKELGTKSSVPAVCIFGYGFKTITAAVVERDPGGALRNADMVVTAKGDGTIPESSAVMRGAEIHPVRQHHGSLYVDSDVKMRLKLELTRDATLRPF